MNTLRPKPKILSLTDAAAEQIARIMARADNDYIAVKVGVENGGCAGMAYTMSYATKQEPHDEVVEEKGVKLFIEPAAIMFLLGTELDYVVDKLSSQFVFNNPNEMSACGCGESVTITPATEQQLQEAKPETH